MNRYSLGLDALTALHSRRTTVVGRYLPGILHGDMVGAVTRRNREKRDNEVIFGYFDIAVEQRKMNGLKNVTVGIARTLLKNGQAAITKAIDVGQNLPGPTARQNVMWKLQWHADQLSGLSNTTATYASGDDLKKWVMQAFIEWNAVEEGSGEIEQMWSDMWSEIGSQIAQLPATIARNVVSVVEDTTDKAASISKWVVAGAVVLGGGILYGLYKVITSDTGRAVATTATGVYLGRR